MNGKLGDEQPGLIDTHVHFYDRTHAGPDLRWKWLDDEFVHPLVGDLTGINGRRFGPPELRAEARLSLLSGVVHVQAARGSIDPVAETLWLSQLASMSDVPILGIVAETHLQQAGVRDVLAGHAAFPLVRGVRDFGDGADYLDDPAFASGYAELARYGWSFDWNPRWPDFAKAARLANRYPEVPLIVEHCGAPPLGDPRRLVEWKRGLTRLASVPNVALKLSGWGMWDVDWTPSTIEPVILACLEAFGTERAFFGSNWPFGRLASSYPDVVDALARVTGTLTQGEQANVFHRSAANWYRLFAH